MKKVILSVFLLVVLLVTAVSSAAAYNIDDYFFTEGVGRVIMNNGTPNIDGNITDGEGWGPVVTIDSTNSTSIWAPSSRPIMVINARYAWDASGLYLAAEINDPSMIPSSGLDELDFEMDPGDMYGWNGDVFVFGIDPADTFYNSGFTTTADRSTWYCISIDETGAFKCYRTQSDVGEVTGDLTGVASLTDNGWKFEVKFPGDIICDDAASMSLGDVSVDAATITELGTTSHSMIMYMDRAYYEGDFVVFSNTEWGEGELFTLSRNMTIPTTLRDGTDGWRNSDSAIRSYGIVLAAADATGNAPETTVPVETEPVEPETTPAPDTTDEVPVDTTKAPVTTAATNNNTTSDTDEGGANIGLIIGIVAAVVVVVAIVVVIVIKKKKA